MGKVNNALVPKDGEVTLRPWQWPINYRGTIFHGWSDDTLRVYLLGNPVVYWLNLPFLLLAPLYALWLRAMEARALPGSKVKADISYPNLLWVFVAWLLHYAPFWMMDRVLYFHHYMPAFLFSCVLTGVVSLELVRIVF